MSQQQKLSRTLSGRHINMIALGGTIGTGLFLGLVIRSRKLDPLFY